MKNNLPEAKIAVLPIMDNKNLSRENSRSAKNILVDLSLRIFGVFLLLSLLYLLLLSPLLFLYPNNNQIVVIPDAISGYLNQLSDSLTGDCFRKSQKFIMLCALPSREVHLSSKHTIVEVQISKKWIAYDPTYKLFFGGKNAIQTSFDINRGYIPTYMQNYPYANSFKQVRFYHNLYFVVLKYLCPFYDNILRCYYSIL
jgi:hypothetical protein